MGRTPDHGGISLEAARIAAIQNSPLLPAVRAGLLARFLLTGLGWWGARNKGVPLPCVTLAYITSSHAPQRLVTSLRPTTSAPVHVGLPRLTISQRRSAFFPEQASPF